MKNIIVGSGIGGLVTALYRTQAGEEVTIVEKDKEAGGRIKWVKQDGFKVDEGPTIVLLPETIKAILAEAGMDPEVLDMERIDPLYRMVFSDGTEFYKWSDQEKQKDEMARTFPGEEEHFERFMRDMKKNFLQGEKDFLSRSFMRKREFFTAANIRSLWQMKAYQSVRAQVADYFTDPRLRDAYSLQTLYIGGNPATTPGIYSLVSFSEQYHGIWYIHGGYAMLIEKIKEELDRRGVTFRFEETALSIQAKGQVFTALKTDKRVEPADRLICNCELPVAEQLVENKSQKKYTSSSGCLLIYLGLDKIYTKTSIHQFFMGSNFDHQMKQIFDKKELPEEPSIYAFHPSLIDSTLAPEGKSVLYLLVPVPSGDNVDWEVQEEFIQSILETVEKKGFPHLRSSIQWMQIRTPQDAGRYGLYEGGSFGIAPSFAQSGAFRPQLKPFSYSNVYAVGASTHPGGGVPIVMQGAKLLAEHLETGIKQDMF